MIPRSGMTAVQAAPQAQATGSRPPRSRKRLGRWRQVACACLALVLVAGCRPRAAQPPDAVSHTVERGPLKFTVTASPRQLAVGDTVRIALLVEAPADYEVRVPEAEDFGELVVRELTPTESRPGPSGLVWRRSFLLEPLISGPLEIPSLTARCAQRGASADTQPSFESELVSEPLRLDVRSALTDADRPDSPRDITGALLPPHPPRPWWHWALLALGAIAAGCAAYAFVRALRRRAARPPPPILTEVWALRALAELAAYDWIERGLAREYYYRLTEIVRQYVERKFALAASEMTTEEFLAMLARDRGALPYDVGRLRDFLEACDYVKYAALQPRREDAEGALATARAFVHATAAGSDAGGCPAGADQAGARTP